jgi:RNA polymerase subunit RPABC4/transcription elongation factor Spt4
VILFLPIKFISIMNIAHPMDYIIEVIAGIIFIVLYFALCLWLTIDAKRRGYSSGKVVLFFIFTLVPVLNIIIFIIYLIIRPAGKMATCPKCGKLGLSTLRKCPNCRLPKKTQAKPAQPIPPPPTNTSLKIKCQHCGQIVEQHWKSCPFCSRKMVVDKTIIDEVFLMYRDGRLIKHFTRRLKPDVDQDILSGMLKAVQDFIRDSFKGETGELDQMNFGRFQILMGHGRFITVAAITMGNEIEPFRPQIIKAIDSMESDYEIILRDWDGDVEQLNVLGRYIMDLIDGRYA